MKLRMMLLGLVVIGFAAIVMTTACGSKDKQPEQPECYAHQHHVLGQGCVDNPVDPIVTPTPVPVANYCSPVGMAVECEAQFGKELGCRKSDNSDWAPSFFKDTATLDAYGKANNIGFKWGSYYSPIVYGAKGGFGWVCYDKK